MASEPFDFSSGPGESPDGEVIPIVRPTVTAFIGRTERGPLNEPVTVKSFDEFTRIYGGPTTFSFLPLAVQHYFWHGGEVAVIVRVANRATRATLELPAGRELLRLQARQPGSREHLRVSVDYDRVERTPDKFNLVVQRVSRPGSQLVDDQEVFEALSMDPTDERFIVDALQDSELVRLVGPLPSYRPTATTAPAPGQPIPYITVKTAGTDGDELTDYDIIGSNAESTGLFALDRCERVDLVCVPSPPGRDLGSTSFLAATRYCERRRALLVWDPPWSWTSADAALLALRASGQASRHALTYFPRVRPRGDNRYPAGLPACGVVAGMLARCDQAGVWHRMPAVDATLRGGLAPLLELGQAQAANLQRLGVNTFLRLQPGVAALQGNVSFAGAAAVDSLWQSLAATRLTAFVVRSIENSTRWVFTAEQPETLAEDLERQVWTFMSRLKQHGALAGATQDQAFFLRTSVAHAPGGDGQDVRIALRVGFAPRAPNEFVSFDFRYHAPTMTTEIRPVRDAERHLG